MPDPLDPARLTPAASLNRLRIADLPGIALPPDVQGHIAYEFLAAAALADEARHQADALGLDAPGDADTDAILRGLDRALIAADPAVRVAALALATRFGERIGYLILALRRGDAANRAARADWDDSYWAHWAGIGTVVLGGGLLSGSLGPIAVAAAARTIRGAGMADCALRLAAHPALLPLIGAARSMPEDCAAAVVLDFGQSFAKRAVAGYRDGVLASLRLLPPVPMRAITLPLSRAPENEAVAALGALLVDVLAASWRDARAAGDEPAPIVVASIASYLRDGQPLPRQGGPYAALHTLSPNLEEWLAARLGATLGQPVGVRLLHDGTAAARAEAGAPRTAVITMGTALGIGFAPPASELRPVADFSPRLASQ